MKRVARCRLYPALALAPALLAGLSLLSPVVGQVAALESSEASVTLEHADGRPTGRVEIVNRADLAPVLRKCLFEHPAGTPPADITPRDFALRCVVPYIHGLWLDPTTLYRSKDSISEQARDKLVQHPAGEAFPVYYPPRLTAPVEAALRDPLRGLEDVVLRPLPDPLPAPSLDPSSLYNNIGLLYLPNPYVVPGEKFNEMYGWDSYFIVRGLLASVDHVMDNPTARVWSPQHQDFYALSLDPDDPAYHRAFAQALFDTAKGMVDNHIFQIEYYGGLILNANRTYYLTRSQPPLFTRSALAVLDSARRYGFDYRETLAPYLLGTREDFTAPQSYDDWLRIEVLPAARRYYAYWTDPDTTWGGAAVNPRVRSVEVEGERHPVYLFGTDGVGPAPEVARSTQPQNRALYDDVAAYFADNPRRNPNAVFYNAETVCRVDQRPDGCGDPIYKLGQAYYAADRAIRASGFDLSGRFGQVGQLAMDYAPISLNVLLLRMAEDIDRLAALVNAPEVFGAQALAQRRSFLARFFRHPSSGGYADRLLGDDSVAGAPRFAYPYATQFYLLWGGVLTDPTQTSALVRSLRAVEGGRSLLATVARPQYGIPTSLADTGKQWDAPFAWAPIQYFAVDGLIAGGIPLEATRAMQQWIAAVNLFFARTGLLIEKYDTADPTNDPRARIGYAKTQRGFGWTNAVYLLFSNRLHAPL